MAPHAYSLKNVCCVQEAETKKKVAKAPKAKAEPKPKAEPKKRKPAPAKKDVKKKKAKKDPNAPKKALSAFMFFSSAKRDEVGLQLAFKIVFKQMCCISNYILASL